MKVDKGVCTSNDDYFADNTKKDLTSVAKFETVFTTLVENKILAIKRECEQHECRKKSRSIKRILLRKTNNTVADAGKKEEKNNLDITGANEGINKNTKKYSQFFSKYYQKSKAVDIEQQWTSENCDELVNVVILQNDNNIDDLEQGVQTYQKSDANVDSQSKNANSSVSNISLKAIADIIVENENLNCDKLVDSKENAPVTQSTTKNSSNTRKQPQNNNYDNDESLATTVDISFPQSSVNAEKKVKENESMVAIVTAPSNNISNKSDIAICDDAASSQSSQNTSDIEFSLVSENSMNELPPNSKNAKKNNNNTNSDPLTKKSVNVISPIINASNKKCKERKASSCQSTPLFKRHKYESEVKKVLTFQKELRSCDQKLETLKSQTVVISPGSKTMSNLTNYTSPATNSKSLEINKTMQRHLRKLHDVSIEYEVTYDNENGNHSSRGLISSFNQLTAQKQPSAVISANIKNSFPIPIKHKQEDNLSTQHDIEVENAHPINNKAIELDAIDINECKRKKRRRRHSSRKIETVVYPSNFKQQCILSKPPNQSIQLDYDSTLVYDVSQQVESEFNIETKSIVPAEHKKYRHKHHHDHERCRKKRRKQKILVHNLDDKSLKLIDPDSDELPQRAKFTIIATACLLLIMCLLLVGVTLRMAPLIDDMVRQENERLLQESLNRAKMAINFTEPPHLSGFLQPKLNLSYQHQDFP